MCAGVGEWVLCVLLKPWRAKPCHHSAARRILYPVHVCVCVRVCVCACVRVCAGVFLFLSVCGMRSISRLESHARQFSYPVCVCVRERDGEFVCLCHTRGEKKSGVACKIVENRLRVAVCTLCVCEREE